MKLVFEREYAECLKAGMTAVLQGEGGDLKVRNKIKKENRKKSNL